MYAIVRTGGHQYRVEEGAVIDVERLNHDVGDHVELREVLLVADENGAHIGRPLVEGAAVQATVVDHILGPKVIIWKYTPKERYRRKKGHRQQYTRLHIDKIVTA